MAAASITFWGTFHLFFNHRIDIGSNWSFFYSASETWTKHFHQFYKKQTLSSLPSNDGKETHTPRGKQRE